MDAIGLRFSIEDEMLSIETKVLIGYRVWFL